jgi:hypothetical protein
LDKKLSEVERPLPWPAGPYAGRVKGKPSFDVSSKKKTPYVEFTLVPTAALEEVDADELAAYEAKSGPITTKQQKTQFYLTDTALFMVKDFLKNCGVDPDGSMSLREAIDSVEGAEVGFMINHEPTNDGEGVFARVGRTFALAE